MIQKNQRYRKKDGANEPDHSGEQDERSGLSEAHGGSGDGGEHRQKNQIPGTNGYGLCPWEKPIETIGMDAAHPSTVASQVSDRNAAATIKKRILPNQPQLTSKK